LRYIVTAQQEEHFLAHSLGHFFSLLERYVDQTGGNDDPSLTEWLRRNETASSPADRHNTATTHK
jgi:hypothetical protein